MADFRFSEVILLLYFGNGEPCVLPLLKHNDIKFNGWTGFAAVRCSVVVVVTYLLSLIVYVDCVV